MKKKIVLLGLTIIAVLFVLTTTTYSLFYKKNKLANTESYATGNLSIEVDTTSSGLGNTLSLTNAYPMSDSDGMNTTPYRFKLTNVGNLNYKFNLNLTRSGTINGSYVKVAVDNNEPVVLTNATTTILSDFILLVGESRTISIRIWLDNNTPNSEIGKTFSGTLSGTGTAVMLELPDFIKNSNAPLDNVNSTYVTGYYESYTLSNEDKATLKAYMANNGMSDSEEADLCIANEGAYSGCLEYYLEQYNQANNPDIVLTGVGNPIPGINFKQNASDTNGKGIYIRSGTENNTYPIYYYRGAVDNNNVYFANFCWKIVRTTETGGLKMIYNGAPTGGSCGTGTTSQTNSTIANSAFNTNYNDAKYVGYTYDNSGTETDSTIKTTIDTWYQTNILTNFDNYIEDTIYCNDREEATAQEKAQIETLYDTTFNATDIIYKPTVRLQITGIPSLNCTNNADKYTKSSLIGNGKLTYPVGLLTADEIWISGMRTSGGNNYLTIANTWWWSLSPNNFGNGYALVWDVYPAFGLVSGSVVYSGDGARPALSLKPGQNFEYGNGTGNNPYRFVATVPNG